ncbi:MAG: 16S rRNA (cytidine(1402)-2'-O)-methyltransferase [Pseudomonadota bacterium]
MSQSLSLSKAPLTPGLYIVPTPLGNLRDITLRALDVLSSVGRVYCEDTRVTAKLLRHYGITAALSRYDDHAGESQRGDILAHAETHAIALVSDAGTPLINDPGFKLAREAIAAGLTVTALPGPSAPLLALTLSGLATDQFSFFGYLPSKAGARQAFCTKLARLEHTLIVFESVHRIAAGLAALADAMPDRPAAVCREMTKLYEEVDHGTLAVLAERWAARAAKGEFVIVIGPAQKPQVDPTLQLKEALADGLSVREAAKLVAKETGASRSTLYEEALALAGKR